MYNRFPAMMQPCAINKPIIGKMIENKQAISTKGANHQLGFILQNR